MNGLVRVICALLLGGALVGRPARADSDPREQLRSIAINLDIEADDLSAAERKALYKKALAILKEIPLVTAVQKTGECRLSGKLEFTTDARIRCKRIVLASDSVIKVPGARILYLDAQSVRVEPGARIEGPGAKGPPGAPGASVGGEWISGSDSAYWAALNDCRSNSNHHDRGGAGAPGGRGSAGAIVVFKVEPQPDLPSINVAGGVGGEGGPGGGGRLYKNSRNYYCDGCTMNCPGGPPGQQGESGPAGAVLFLK